MERRLYLARKQFERARGAGRGDGLHLFAVVADDCVQGDVPGQSAAEFYPDLASAEYVTPFAVFHQRYATNTLPTWHRAQPGRKLAHNGEINTVWGNRARMAARDSTLPVECKPVLTQGGTDSTSWMRRWSCYRRMGGRWLRRCGCCCRRRVTKRVHLVPAVPHGVRGAVGWAGGDCVQRRQCGGRGAGPQWSAALPVCDYERGHWWLRARRRAGGSRSRKR